MEVINVDDLLGIPHTKNGRDVHTGLDCFGLAMEVEKRFGHTLIDLEDFKDENKVVQDFEQDYKKLVNLQEIKKPENPSDLILFKDIKGISTHIGVYLGDDLFIHSPNSFVKIDKLSRYNHIIGRVYKWL